ncbi:nitroreductase family protein [Murimonas intestini]|uniref:Nitroreductase n=1 Tax=Murimonas intestini TaxID=1337051 RepID=A0AB73TAF1_9FIRM|nr:nitroreductase family protein [Murimonas intestini]MCR1838934.1 nitroreductase family protein [Murimonas intestini]MCR1864230.1 nitroreductase family protein [Murimonas intestini]MCR1881840.1 nitroreductase family protein [Murimonas intestini]
MERFNALIKKDGSGRLTIIEIPFNAKEVFHKSRGAIYVSGTINGIEYRSKLLSRGSGKFVMVLDKAMQKSIGFDGQEMTVNITMASEDLEAVAGEPDKIVDVTCGLDVLTAIKTRQSIRKFTAKPVSEDMVSAILYAGMCAPTAKDKRPYHFIVIRDRCVLSMLAQQNSNAAMLESSAGAIIVCGDKSREGIKEFLYADCAAAAQNILLCIHGLGLGGVWCGVVPNSDWRKLLIGQLALPNKLEPISVIAFGWPDEEKELCPRWETAKVHYDKW